MKRLLSLTIVALCAHTAQAQYQTAESIRAKLGSAQASVQQAAASSANLSQSAESIRSRLTAINNQLLAGQPVDALALNQALQASSALSAQLSSLPSQLGMARETIASASNDLASSDPYRQAVCYTLDAKGNLAIGEAGDVATANTKAHAGLRYVVSKEGCSVRPQVSVQVLVSASGPLNGVQCTVISGKSRTFIGTGITETDAMVGAFQRCGAECGMYRLNNVTCVNM